MTTRTILGRKTSSNVMKVVWLLEELGLPYERVDIGGPFGGNDTPDYLALNPNGKVPTFIEDGFVLWESNAILAYVCNQHAPNSSLYPRQPKARADVDRWMYWQQTTVDAPQRTLLIGMVRTPPEKRDPKALAAAAEELRHFWPMLDRQLEGRDFVCGDFTLADMTLGPHVHRWFAYEIEKPELPALRRWYERLLEMPIYRQHVALPVV